MSEPDVSALLTVAQAIEILDRTVVGPRVVEVRLEDAVGLRLAEELRADRDYPPFDKSLMDGYAVRAADVGTGGVELRLVGEVAAGVSPVRAVGAGECVAIMTGAPLPAGADGVVPVEEAEQAGHVVRIKQADAPGRYIARRGVDLLAAQVVLEKGQLIGPAQVAAAATVGAARVKCFARPRAGVLATGDELVAIGDMPGAAQIRNSNSPMLCALLTELGCEVTDLGVARDEPAALRSALERGLEQDVLFVSGGMSMGAYDYVPRVLGELGVEAHVTKLRIKPGKPFLFGTREAGGRTTHVFGLPGNPVSGYVCTVRLAARVLQRLAGGRVEEQWVTAKLATPLPANGPREFYQPVRLEVGPGETVAWPLAWKGSADLFTLAKAQGLLVRGENEPAREAGAAVRVFELP
ncbi:MAG TPA: gephyrin-like molybdotransferase Glp [Tepidisphaeraceae bacterium]|nr:gephyrin-like molybdotransferase Glp [Tepidisphaeraceae bacterium]